jgi:hypothetical protein
MAKRKNSAKRLRSKRILPIDERVLPDIISFTHVKGAARIFLAVEMICAVLVVLGTFVLVIIREMHF